MAVALPNQKVCPQCRLALVPDVIYCPMCGTKQPGSATFVPSVGQPSLGASKKVEKWAVALTMGVFVIVGLWALIVLPTFKYSGANTSPPNPNDLKSAEFAVYHVVEKAYVGVQNPIESSFTSIPLGGGKYLVSGSCSSKEYHGFQVPTLFGGTVHFDPSAKGNINGWSVDEAHAEYLK